MFKFKLKPELKEASLRQHRESKRWGNIHGSLIRRYPTTVHVQWPGDGANAWQVTVYPMQCQDEHFAGIDWSTTLMQGVLVQSNDGDWLEV